MIKNIFMKSAIFIVLFYFSLKMIILPVPLQNYIFFEIIQDSFTILLVFLEISNIYHLLNVVYFLRLSFEFTLIEVSQIAIV